MKIKSFQGGYDKNLCYLLWCESTKLAAIIDPAVEVLPVVEFVKKNDLTIDKILITHTHHDHIRYLDDIIDIYPHSKLYISKFTPITSNYHFTPVDHHDVVMVGEHIILSLYTPGHYIDSICYWVKDQDMLFTGDTMFVGRTGRTINSRSSISDLYSSVYDILLKLPLKTIVYPGHHYGFSKSITLEENIKLSNFFQCKNLEEFKIIMLNYENNRKK